MHYSHVDTGSKTLHVISEIVNNKSTETEMCCKTRVESGRQCKLSDLNKTHKTRFTRVEDFRINFTQKFTLETIGTLQLKIIGSLTNLVNPSIKASLLLTPHGTLQPC
jgi:hypothetical protein